MGGGSIVNMKIDFTVLGRVEQFTSYTQARQTTILFPM